MKRDMISRIFDNLDLKNAPAVITVDHGMCECRYIKQKNGYFGVPVEKSNKRRFRFGHNICLRGDDYQQAGHVYPPVATNMLCQDKPGSRQSVEEATYKDRITSTLAAIALTCMKHGEAKENVAEFATKIGAPEWMSFVEGEASDDEIRTATLSGVAPHLLEFAEVSGCKVSVDVLSLLEGQIHKKFICVRPGDWDDESQLLAKSVRLSSGVILLAKEKGLALKDARATKKKRSSAAKKTG